MPKRLAVLILVTFIPVVQYITKILKDYKRKNFKSDLGLFSFGIIWLCLFIWLLVGLIKWFI